MANQRWSFRIDLADCFAAFNLNIRVCIKCGNVTTCITLGLAKKKTYLTPLP